MISLLTFLVKMGNAETLAPPTLHRVTYWLTWIEVWFCIMLLAPVF